MMIRISLGLVWLLLAVIVLCLILLRRWMKKKAILGASEQRQVDPEDSSPGETAESLRDNQ